MKQHGVINSPCAFPRQARPTRTGIVRARRSTIEMNGGGGGGGDERRNNGTSLGHSLGYTETRPRFGFRASFT